jgi:hypothetical protein
MKTAEQWLNEVGEVVMFSAFVGGRIKGLFRESYAQQQRRIRREGRWARVHAAFLAGRNPDEDDL